jgi:IK cytokine
VKNRFQAFAIKCNLHRYVKGLDFALLSKVRAEMTESVKDEEYERGAGAAAGGSAAGAAGAGGAAVQVAADGKVASFRTPMARSIYELAVKGLTQSGGGGEAKPNERFASGRVSFTFDVNVVTRDTEGVVSDIPTTTMRSRSDVDAAKGGSAANMMMAGRDAAVLERLSNILVYLRVGGKSGKKMQRKKEGRAEADRGGGGSGGLGGTPGGAGAAAVGLAQPPRALVPVDDDDDIFGDVGRDYEPTVAKKKETTESDDKAASYFGDGHAKGEASAALPKTKLGSADAAAGGADGASGAGVGGVVSMDANGLLGPMPEAGRCTSCIQLTHHSSKAPGFQPLNL